MKTSQRFPFYEFFAGAGLAREGLGRCWQCIWANDNDPKKQEVYTANFGKKHFVLEDIAKLDSDSLPDSPVLAWASFPCQDLSLAGWQRGMSAERSGTFWPFWRLMRNLYDDGRRPPVIVIENVAGLLYGDNFTGLCEALAALDLQFGALMIDAKHFVPQSRPRVFIVAVDSHLGVEEFHHREALQECSWFPPRVQLAHDALPENLAERWRWWRLPHVRAKPAAFVDLLEEKAQGVSWLVPDQVQRLVGLMTERNREKVEQAKVAGGRQVGFLYKRTRDGKQRAEVRFDGVAGCLRTPRGGSSRQTLLVVENGDVRARLISSREAARLMGVRDTFKLPAAYNQAYLAMGDAVVVPAVRWLTRHLLTPIAEKALESTASTAAIRPLVDEHRQSTEDRAEKWQRSMQKPDLEEAQAGTS